MGSSTRKKKEKAKDFQVCRTIPLQSMAVYSQMLQKPKFKVGKTKAKASNFTDTSFKSRCAYSLPLLPCQPGLY